MPNNFPNSNPPLSTNIEKIWVSTPLPSIAIETKGLPLLAAKPITANFDNNTGNLTIQNFQNNENYQNSLIVDYDATSILGTVIYDTITLSYYNNSYSASNASQIGGAPITQSATSGGAGAQSINNPPSGVAGGAPLSRSLDLTCYFDTVKFTVTQTRNIVTTPINGLDGTVKEFISDGDYIIDCEAIIAFNGINYIDYQFLQNIQNLLLVQDTIQIQSQIINTVFNVQNVVVKNYSFTQPEVGMRNIQSLKFSLLSDNPNSYNVIF
jgi:hypothetical protein